VSDEGIPRGLVALHGPVEVHFDGACEPPRGGGVATFGFHLEGAGFLYEDCGLAVTPYSRHATNNVAEYVAAIRPLEWLRARGYEGEVRMVGDSQLVVRQMRGEYAVRAEHLKAYHDQLRRLVAGFRRVEFRWVPREENGRADALSKRALEEAAATSGRFRPSTPVDVPAEEEPPDPPGP
jgi:ribonuclease HI